MSTPAARTAPKARAPRTRATAKTGNPKADQAARSRAAAKTGPKPKAPSAAYRVPKGYVLRWPHRGYDLLKKTGKGTEGPAWWVACTAHGEMTGADNAKDGDAKGTRAALAGWCKGHKADAAKK